MWSNDNNDINIIILMCVKVMCGVILIQCVCVLMI